MRKSAKRVRSVMALLLSLSLVAAACGDDGDAVTTTEATTATTTTSEATAATSAEEPLRVAILMPGSVTDKAYNADAKLTAETLEAELGALVTYTESVQVPNQADVYRQFANQGYDLVIGWGGQFTDGALTVAEEFPDVKFLVMNSNAANGTNMTSIDTAIEQWQFVAGYVLGRLSESGVIGFVGGGCIPATAAHMHGTMQGALYANPDIDFRATFTGDWEDPTAAQQAAQAMIDVGADALTGNLNNGWFGIFEAARAGGDLPVITEWLAENQELAPDVIVSAVLKSQVRFVVDIARSVMDGTWSGEPLFFTLPANWGPAISNTELLPDDIYEAALGVQAQVASGEIKVERDENCPG